jgi:hypothetical protein
MAESNPEAKKQKTVHRPNQQVADLLLGKIVIWFKKLEDLFY